MQNSTPSETRSNRTIDAPPSSVRHQVTSFGQIAVDGKSGRHPISRPMPCLIFAGVAKRIYCQGPWEERDCPLCGHYRMADALILTMMEQGQIFDVA